jgi:homopolymeric O-antigen transport system permease protein
LNTNDNTKLPPHEQAFEWARQAAQEKNWKAAAQRWEILRRVYPEQPATWLQGANAHIEAGELKYARTLLDHARQEFPNHPQSLTESALLAMREEKWSLAEEFLLQAREKHPDFTQAWLRSTEYAEKMGDLKQASAYSEKACQCNPELPGPYIQHAELAMRNKQWEQALERWDILRTRFPELPAGYLRAAEAARQLGRPKEARQLILAHQYGDDILNSETNNQDTPKQHSSHTNLGRLLELVWTKSIFNLRSEVHRNYLSYGWWILEPLLHMGVYYLVFGLLLQRGVENYPVFLLAGLIPWMWFTKAVSGSSNSIIAGQNLMLQVGLPPVVFPLASLLQATIKQIPVFILLFGFLWLQGFSPGAHWWALIPVIAVQALLTVAFASMVAAVIPFIRDLSYLVPTGLMFLMFLSGIFYDYKSISPEWQSLFLMNPIAFLLKSYREIFIDGALPDMQTLAWWGLGSAAACAMLIFAFKRLRYIYPRVVME